MERLENQICSVFLGNFQDEHISKEEGGSSKKEKKEK